MNIKFERVLWWMMLLCAIGSAYQRSWDAVLGWTVAWACQAQVIGFMKEKNGG